MARPGLLQAWHAECVPRAFHATFSAQWRRYLYLLPRRTPGCSAGAAEEAAASTTAAASLPGGRMGAVFAGLERLPGCDAAAVDAAPDADPAK